MNVAITVDLEDWFQLITFRPLYPVDEWTPELLRVQIPLAAMLELFDSYGIKATFFVLGWFGANCPDLVRAIRKQGHEIASHGMTHVLNSQIDKDTMRYEIEASKRVLEETIQERVLGYRATSFTVSDGFLDMLIAAGYRYDSSNFPFSHNKQYGRVSETKLKTAEKVGFKEFSIPLARFMKKQIPFSGGSYFRLLPFWLISKAISANTQDPLVMYFHPWEFDKGLTKIEGLPIVPKLRHFTGIRSNLRKLRKTLDYLRLKGYSFETLGGLT